TESFILTVGEAPTITSFGAAGFTVGTTQTFTITTGHSFPTPMFTRAGVLPAGVAFTDNHDGTATLSGTPAAGSEGTYGLTFTAGNGVAPDAVQPFVLAVSPSSVTPPGGRLDSLVGRDLETGQWFVARSNGASGFTTALAEGWSPDVVWADVRTAD